MQQETFLKNYGNGNNNVEKPQETHSKWAEAEMYEYQLSLGPCPVIIKDRLMGVTKSIAVFIKLKVDAFTTRW
jgi:hypothetical protein